MSVMLFNSSYIIATSTNVEECGVFVSVAYPSFLATSPDGFIQLRNEELGIVEVKCLYKHRDSSIEMACQDPELCSEMKGRLSGC